MGVRHLLLTSDFPPKTGGIQSYLWDLWSRLDPDEVCVVTPRHPDASAWDRTQPFRIERVADPWLVPHPGLVRRVNRLACEFGADLIVVDPVLPLALAACSPGGLRFDRPIAAVIHGAEVTVPARAPLLRRAMRAALANCDLLIAAGGYPLAEAEAVLGRRAEAVVVPPGVDRGRFRPSDAAERAATRRRFGLPEDATVVLGLSRLVRRKGFDVLIRAADRVASRHGDLVVAIGGTGRDSERLHRIAARVDVPVHFLGRVPDADLSALYGAADLFAMLCRDRWAGWEQEGFGIVFLEAAACGVAQIAGRSGGSHEAVVHDRTGLVCGDPTDVAQVAGALESLVVDEARRRRFADEGLRRVEADFDLDRLSVDLGRALTSHATGATARRRR